MYSTAWTKGSSLPSGRIPPPKANTSSSKGKAKQKDPPRSKKVRRLEDLRNNLRNSNETERDPKGGCFCQGTFASLVDCMHRAQRLPIVEHQWLVLCSQSAQIIVIHAYMQELRFDPLRTSPPVLRLSALRRSSPDTFCTRCSRCDHRDSDRGHPCKRRGRTRARHRGGPCGRWCFSLALCSRIRQPCTGPTLRAPCEPDPQSSFTECEDEESYRLILRSASDPPCGVAR